MSSINTSVEDEDDSFHKQLDKEISKASKPSKIDTSAIATDLESIIRVEMCVFETGGGGREVFLSATYNVSCRSENDNATASGEESQVYQWRTMQRLQQSAVSEEQLNGKATATANWSK
ncbi:hypothetical protein ACJJTC_010635 [Scirpophaga incertulas]